MRDNLKYPMGSYKQEMVDPLLCMRISNIVCGGSVRPPISSTVTYGYEFEFFPGMPLVKG